jgi:hypothetical protein
MGKEEGAVGKTLEGIGRTLAAVATQDNEEFESASYPFDDLESDYEDDEYDYGYDDADDDSDEYAVDPDEYYRRPRRPAMSRRFRAPASGRGRRSASKKGFKLLGGVSLGMGVLVVAVLAIGGLIWWARKKAKTQTGM